MTTTLLLVATGLVLLVLGGDLLVRGSVKAATRLGVSPLVIGLTLVGFGTSTPELVTSVQASLAGAPGIAIGNIVGSNIANILLILGISALIAPIAIDSRALRRDGVVALAAAIAFAALAFVWPLDRVVGAVFVVGLAVYIFTAFRQERAVVAAPEHGALYDKAVATQGADEALVPDPAEKGGSLVWPILLALAGLVLVVGGGKLLVDGATELARGLGISEAVIGLTVVAVGTSLPELVTSVVAALRRQADVAFGNIVGSNIYNILGIGGVTGLIAPVDIPVEIARFDAPIMVGVTLLMLLFAFTSRRIVRWEGAVLIAGYVAYVWLLWPA
ncbi:calcium/sodium antiporter [Salinarimonas ramus]|uniref:Sodium:calcium antiporter n=1 Tax=Salinarimonas ramus TaxID=690164 RepID=A0A917QGS0_9HYPH|nr:calcium/sodium antiporter [Salinarimonas ramus]GGK49851.1 sodium:calcium antiporter [Salinarimonas ramus]